MHRDDLSDLPTEAAANIERRRRQELVAERECLRVALANERAAHWLVRDRDRVRHLEMLLGHIEEWMGDGGANPGG